MILLDTQVWVWWATQTEPVKGLLGVVAHYESDGLGVSAFSIWEVAKKVQVSKLVLSLDLDSWVDLATRAPGVRMLEADRRVLVQANRLPQPFHRDPADQIIVATAIVHELPVLTTDRQINAYAHVKKVDART